MQIASVCASIYSASLNSLELENNNEIKKLNLLINFNTILLFLQQLRNFIKYKDITITIYLIVQIGASIAGKILKYHKKFRRHFKNSAHHSLSCHSSCPFIYCVNVQI